MAKSLRTLPADAFSHWMRDAKRIAFFVGAGCSVSSGIPAARALVEQHWLPRLRDRHAPSRQDLLSWAREFLPDYDPTDPAAAYGSIISKLFYWPEERQREIENLCAGKFPSFGYGCLATLVADGSGRFNVVLTTNFDDLLADALYLFTSSKPLIIPHESLASYIRATSTTPLIVKLHSDSRLSPHNTQEETSTLEKHVEHIMSGI